MKPSEAFEGTNSSKQAYDNAVRPMTDEECFEKAIEKACKNGYEKDCLPWRLPDLEKTIFSHDFAKAFWGEETVDEAYRSFPKREWQYHLQQMVLKENPIQYLAKFL